MIQLSELNYDVSEQLAVKRVLDSGWLTMGSEVASFERILKTLLKIKLSGSKQLHDSSAPSNETLWCSEGMKL